MAVQDFDKAESAVDFMKRPRTRVPACSVCVIVLAAIGYAVAAGLSLSKSLNYIDSNKKTLETLGLHIHGTIPKEYNFVTHDVNSMVVCAMICSNVEAVGGSWTHETLTCYCAFRLVCLEPCLEESGVEFATIPKWEIPQCEKSYCHPDMFGLADSNNIECCSTMNYDEEACELKISNNGGIVRGDFSRHGYQHT